MNSRLRRRGRYFSRNYKDDRGFQILIMGCMWISVGISDYYSPKMNPHPMGIHGGTEYLDGVCVLWSDCATMSMIDA